MILQRKLDAPVVVERLLLCPVYGNNNANAMNHHGQSLTEINFDIWTIVGMV